MTKVLVADDTKNIRTLLMKCLQLEGYEVSTADDGKEALDALLQEDFGLVFLDIKMPLLSGTEVLKKAREAGVLTPVIIITAYATVKNAVECTQLGAVAYLQKPFTADKVRNVLAELQDSKTEVFGSDADVLRRLKKELAERPLDASIYLELSLTSERLGLAEEAEKYRRISESLGET